MIRQPIAVVAAAAALASCGGPPGPAAPARAGDATRPPDARAEAAAPRLRSIESLAARGAELARGMREVDRAEIAVAAGTVDRDIVRGAASDTCARVAFAATVPVHAAIVDAKDRVVAEIEPAHEGALGERGPVCARRGDAIRLRISADRPAQVRYVAWASP